MVLKGALTFWKWSLGKETSSSVLGALQHREAKAETSSKRLLGPGCEVLSTLSRLVIIVEKGEDN